MPTQTATLTEFQARFEKSILPKWRSVKSQLGHFLIEAETNLSEPFYKSLRLWLKTQHHIAYSLQVVCMRVAKGEMTDEQASLIPASIAKNIPVDKMPDPDKEYKIYSPDAGGVVRKKFRDFSPSDKKVNLTNHGIRIETIPAKAHKPFVKTKASSFRVDRRELILLVNSTNTEVHIPITVELIDALTSCRKVS